MIDTLVVFGAGGDLAGRLLLPAVAALLADGRLGPDFRLIGAGVEDLTTAGFGVHVRQRLAEYARHVEPAARDALVAALHYRRADVTVAADVHGVLDLAGTGSGPVAVYLALPSQLMLAAAGNVIAVGLPADSRIVVEKPFGYDAASAAHLNAALAPMSGPRGDVYRVDHVLAMPAVQRMGREHLPGPDRPIGWSSRDIERLELLYEETLGLEGRASFYDRAGALRDVMQNHLLQVLCTLAASPASTDAGDGPSQRRADVLRTVRPLSSDDVVASTRRARYVAGRLAADDGGNGRAVPDYAAQDGVDPGRATETFAEVVLHLDSPTWSGVPFVLRAGKALAARRRGVLVHLRPDVAARSPLWLDLDAPPAGSTGPAEPFAYQQIVADVLGGGTTFAVSGEEAELGWQVFTPVLEGWAAATVPLLEYPAGSSGP